MDKLKNIFILLCAVLVLDVAVFRNLVWLLPNESAQESERFYHFIHTLDRIAREKPEIVLAGSSLAYYSFDADSVREAVGKKYDVEIMSHAGMTPMDLWFYLDRLEGVKLLVYPVNFIDFRLHRAYVLGADNETISMEEQIRDALFYDEAPQSRLLYPLQALGFSHVIGAEKSAEFLSAVFFGFYRYRDIWWQNIAQLYNHRFGRNTSYHSYLGAEIPEGVTRRGWTGRYFSFLPEYIEENRSFYVEIVPELLQNGPFFIEFAQGDTRQKAVFNRSGWQKVEISDSFFSKNRKITARLSAVWSPLPGDIRQNGVTNIGVRLQENFGIRKFSPDLNRNRRRFIEDSQFDGMPKEEYDKYFTRWLKNMPNDPGMIYLEALMRAKKNIAREKFRKTLQFVYLEKLVKKAKQRGIKLLLVNHPENPLSLEWYEKSDWYGEYLEYLKSMDCAYSDLRNELPRETFADYHHITMKGRGKLARTINNEIIKSL